MQYLQPKYILFKRIAKIIVECMNKKKLVKQRKAKKGVDFNGL